MFDFYRMGAAVPNVKVADVRYNKEQMLSYIQKAKEQGVTLLTFPELCLTGYTCADLFLQSCLLEEAKNAAYDIVQQCADIDMILAFGMPLEIQNALYNVAVIAYKGRVCGINVKTFLPNYNEFYEKRWFSAADCLMDDTIMASELFEKISIEDDYDIPIGNDIIYQLQKGYCFGVEICEDLWAPVTPSDYMAMQGAQVILNLSASNDTIGKREYRRALVSHKSTALMCAYLYVSAGSAESSTDLIFSGHSMLAENGKILYENDCIADDDYLLVMDLDLGKIQANRLKGKTYQDSARIYGSMQPMRRVLISQEEDMTCDGTYLSIRPHPFTPKDSHRRKERCMQIFRMQIGGLQQRLRVCGSKMVIGVSGGMDSTLALLVAAQTLKKMGKPMTDLVGITMPAFGTTNRTYQNSIDLMKSLGITTKEIPIKEACLLHYADIEHDANTHDITYENVQARERTQVLMDYANKIGAIVVGTGDLSELALGWCTYNADQMSMYGVNASIPKTLVKWMIASVVEANIFPESTKILEDIIDTPISPELLPPDENGNIVQKTEDSVGPYELHDFFLYYVMRYGFAPDKIYWLAKKAFEAQYDENTILKWMRTFYQRFFSQQFKRSCMPDGVKVGSVCLSPRGDWRMPSDASVRLWMDILEKL
ncbi:MAG: NAD(+) synthase [Wujia sp.]